MWLRSAIFLLSASALGYEILLTRLFAITQWHHFASLVISLALFGYAASGTFLSLTRDRLLRRFEAGFLAGAVGFALSSIGCFALAQRLAFNPLEIVWTLRQLGYLGLIQLLLALPFFCAATSIGLTLMRFRGEIARIYRADLLGAGAGVALVVVALTLRRPEDCLALLSGTALLAAAAASLDRRLALPRWCAPVLATLALVVGFWPQGGPALRLSEYKGLSKVLRVPETKILLERSSPLGLISVVESERIPFRDAPGLSLAFPGRLPEQLGVFTDGDAMTAIDRYAPRLDRLGSEPDYLDYLPSALPYQLLDSPIVAVVGAGGGREVRSALRHGASSVAAIEQNRQMLELLQEDFDDYSGGLYRSDRVTLHLAAARGFFARTDQSFDLIQIAYVEAVGGGSGAAYALQPSTLYTVESFEILLERLREGGLLAITRRLEVPPRGGLKLFATALEALERATAAGTTKPLEHSPADSLALIRSWDSLVLLVKRGAFSAQELGTLRRFCDSRSFDLAYLPGMDAAEANRFNVLEQPFFFEGSRAILGSDRQSFFDDYKFNIEPATDDHPYFFHVFKWKTLPELLRLRTLGGPALIEWGYVLLIAALVEAALAGLILILTPLWLSHLRSAASTEPAMPTGLVGLYFFCLGLAFLFIEIAFIQHLVLFLVHPIYAVAVVLGTFLVFAGLGSGASTQWAAWWNRLRAGTRKTWTSPITMAAAGIVAISLLYLLLLPALLESWVGWGLAAKVALSITLIAPLAFLMGMPFPLGLERVGSVREAWIPWAWGVNGWASVLAALLASLLAIHLGFSAVILAACGLYLLAAVAIRAVP